ncbi:hypothetical protein HS7_12680 [Sulfolobales archaeon HS-7]|nr:hypothetical protein HS7_12680 [Sulfolobales archaeon HS-7]
MTGNNTVKEIILEKELPYNYRKLQSFFLNSGCLRLFYEVEEISKISNLTYLINGKVTATLHLKDQYIIWIISKNNYTLDQLVVLLIPYLDNTVLHLRFTTKRILPLRRSLEREVNAELELLRELLYALRQ